MKSDLFRSMPPMRHNRVLAKSAVLAHIQEATGESPEAAVRTFRYLRNKRHIIFDRAFRWWRGVEYVGHESEDDFRRRVTSEVNRLTITVRRLRTQLEQQAETIKALSENNSRMVSAIRELKSALGG
jgi:NAD-specific glutamate dehydrogenase